jgi:hypothetical protein
VRHLDFLASRGRAGHVLRRRHPGYFMRSSCSTRNCLRLPARTRTAKPHAPRHADFQRSLWQTFANGWYLTGSLELCDRKQTRGGHCDRPHRLAPTLRSD